MDKNILIEHLLNEIFNLSLLQASSNEVLETPNEVVYEIREYCRGVGYGFTQKNLEFILSALKKFPKGIFSGVDIQTSDDASGRYMISTRTVCLPKTYVYRGITGSDFFFTALHELRHAQQNVLGILSNKSNSLVWNNPNREEVVIAEFHDLKRMVEDEYAGKCDKYNYLPWEMDANGFAFQYASPTADILARLRPMAKMLF